MIRTLTYRGRLDGKDLGTVSDAIRAQVSKLVRSRNTIRGIRVTGDAETIDISLRMSGLDRWRIYREARKIASFLLASQRVAFTRPLYPVLEVTEPSARQLTLAQGRTPQSVTGGRGRRKPPVEVPQDWWGDELPQ